MLRDVLFIGKKDLLQTLRARETILWVFIMPILFFYFIGTVTAGFGPSEARPDRLVLEAEDNPGFLLDELTRRLEEQNYRVTEPDSAGVHSRVLRIPPAFTDSVLAGSKQTLSYRYMQTGLGGDYERIRIARATYTMLADLVVAREDTANAGITPEAFEKLAARERALTLDVQPAGTRKVIPTGFSQAVPGIIVMFSLLVMTTSGAVLLVIERQQGLLRRLASAPIGRGSVVLGKWGARLGVGMVQLAFGMLSGTILFKMDWGPDLITVVVVLMVYSALMAAVGMLLGCIARTEGQAVAIGVVSANVLGALGGCWWPIEITPAWMQKLQLFLPTGWAMDAMHRLISFEAGPSSVAPHLLGMSIALALALWGTSRLFRYE